MAYYNNTATVINNSQYTLVFDPNESSSNCVGVWPATISNNGQPITVQQTGNINMDFSAAYTLSGGADTAWIVFHFYNAVFIGYSWNMTLLAAGNGNITGVNGTLSINYDGPVTTSQSPLKLSGGGFGGSPSTAETFTISSISLMI